MNSSINSIKAWIQNYKKHKLSQAQIIFFKKKPFFCRERHLMTLFSCIGNLPAKTSSGMDTSNNQRINLAYLTNFILISQSKLIKERGKQLSFHGNTESLETF